MAGPAAGDGRAAARGAPRRPRARGAARPVNTAHILFNIEQPVSILRVNRTCLPPEERLLPPSCRGLRPKIKTKYTRHSRMSVATYPQCTQISDGYSAAQALAANIFDWGAKATVQLYHNGTILEIYRCGIFSAIGFDSFMAEVAVAALCRRSSSAASFACAVHGLRSNRARKVQTCLA